MATTHNPTEVGDSIGQRLAAAARAHRDAQEIARRCSDRLQALIVEANEAGMGPTQLAGVTGVVRSRIHAILERQYSQAG